MPMENPDIIQLGSLIRDSSQLGGSSFTSQTGIDIGDDTAKPGDDTNLTGRNPESMALTNANEAEKKRVQLSIVAFVGGIITGGVIGSILQMGRKRK